MASKPELDIFTGSKDLGTVFKEQNQLNIKFFELNAPMTDSTGRIASNVLGATRIIIVQGAHDGTNFDGATQDQKLADFVYEMEQWLTPPGFPSIQTSAVYTDSLGVSYEVDGVDWMWVRSFNDPSRILYTIMMKGA